MALCRSVIFFNISSRISGPRVNKSESVFGSRKIIFVVLAIGSSRYFLYARNSFRLCFFLLLLLLLLLPANSVFFSLFFTRRRRCADAVRKYLKINIWKSQTSSNFFSIYSLLRFVRASSKLLSPIRSIKKQKVIIQARRVLSVKVARFEQQKQTKWILKNVSKGSRASGFWDVTLKIGFAWVPAQTFIHPQGFLSTRITAHFTYEEARSRASCNFLSPQYPDCSLFSSSCTRVQIASWSLIELDICQCVREKRSLFFHFWLKKIIRA